MEDVLQVYKLPYDDKLAVLIIDEIPKQPFSQTREPILCQTGKSVSQDYEYKRKGEADLFKCLSHCKATALRKWPRNAEKSNGMAMKQVADDLYPQTKKTVVALDNLNTHIPSAFYETFTPEEARRLVELFEFHFTPKHGNLWNMAEIELSASQSEDSCWGSSSLAEAAQRRGCYGAIAIQNTRTRTKIMHHYPKIQMWQTTWLSNDGKSTVIAR